MENLNAEVCEKCGCMYVVDKPHICHRENSYVPKLNLPRELAREISLKNTIAFITSQEQRIKELIEENERLRAEKELNENEEKYILSTVMVAPIDYTVEEYRKRVYRKMEKYTVFGREYIQRIMREVAKEMLEEEK